MKSVVCVCTAALLATLLAATCVQARDYDLHPVEALVRVYPYTRADLDALGRISPGLEGMGLNYFDVLARPEQIDRMIDERLAFDVIIEDFWGWRLEQGFDAPPSEYTDYSELVTFLNQVISDHEEIAALYDLGPTYGGSRRIWALKISDNVLTDEAEPEVELDAAIHGDEVVGVELLVSVINQLTDGYDADWNMTDLVDDLEIWFIPMMNPDGHNSSSRYNSDGVDLNRDYGYMWDAYGGSTSPYGETETRDVGSFWFERQFVMGTSYHGGTLFFAFPWSYHYDNTPDHSLFNYLGAGYSAYPSLSYGQGSIGMYVMHGSTKDALYGTLGTLGWTIEISSSKTPPYSQVAAIVNANDDGVFWLMSETDTGIEGFITDADSDSPLPAVLWIDPMGWMAYSDGDLGDYFRVLRPGTYSVTAWTSGYQAQTHAGVVVADGSRTAVDFELTPETVPNNYGYRWLYSYMPNSEDTHGKTADVLGPPDSAYVSIGNGGYVVIDMGLHGAIVNGTGNDVIVWEAPGTSEGFSLYGSNQPWHSPSGNWTLIGSGTGTTSFDLNSSGLSSVRYFRIQDDADKSVDHKGAEDGFDLDAIGGAALLECDFVGDPYSGQTPLIVQFTDLSVGQVTSRLWDFGDGHTSTERNPSHTYETEGSFTVSLEIDGPLGTLTETKEDYIQTAWGPPTANFSGDPLSGVAPLEVEFEDQSEGSVETWSWDFGDSSQSSDQNPTHVYELPGSYTVSLTITGPGGDDTKLRENYVTVRCPKPAVDFSGSPTSGPAPLTVDFTDATECVEGCVSNYAWEFGDGQTSAEQSPSHVYDAPGVYSVTLTAAGPAGSDSMTKEGYVTVTGPDDDDDGDDDSAGGGDDDDDSGCGCSL